MACHNLFSAFQGDGDRLVEKGWGEETAAKDIMRFR